MPEKNLVRQSRITFVSEAFNIDNGAGTTVDRVLARASVPLKILSARIIYGDATTGTVAAGNMRVGTTVGGSEIVASTAYENTKAVGTKTEMTLATAYLTAPVAVDTPIIVRHTGVAITQAGFATLELEAAFDE